MKIMAVKVMVTISRKVLLRSRILSSKMTAPWKMDFQVHVRKTLRFICLPSCTWS